MTSPTGRRAQRALLALSAVLALVVAPGELLAQAPAAVRARLEGRLDDASRAAVERVVDSVHALGLPAEPLVDKALEGASKSAPREAILRAVRALASDLAVARRQLGPQSQADELTAGAVALRGGIEEGALRRLREERPGQPLVVALGVLTDLVARGVPATDASRAVLGLTRAGIADEQLVAFRRDVERDIGIGAPPAATVTLRALSLQRDGGSAGSANRSPSPRHKP